jgi:hypothetical protein
MKKVFVLGALLTSMSLAFVSADVLIDTGQQTIAPAALSFDMIQTIETADLPPTAAIGTTFGTVAAIPQKAVFAPPGSLAASRLMATYPFVRTATKGKNRALERSPVKPYGSASGYVIGT